MKRVIIGVMGPAQAGNEILALAYDLGRQIAAHGWITLSGGRMAGVMHMVSKGARDNNGITLGILPGDDIKEVSPYIDIPVLTGMGSARNNINVLTADIVVACGMGAGTASEVALAVKAGKKVLLLGVTVEEANFFEKLGREYVQSVDNVEQVITSIESLLNT